MPPAEVQWQPGLVVLVSGIVLGALLVWWVRRRGGPTEAPAPEARPLELRDLDGRIAVLLRQLRELDDAAAKRTPEQLARERYALELEAARALQAREALAPKRRERKPDLPAAARSCRLGFLWGAASAAAVALLLFLVWQQAERRPEGGSVTGSTPGGAPGPEEPADERTAQLRAVLARNPEDHDARLDLARQLLMRRDLMGVWNETQQVLERQPGHPRALTYQALVRLAMGQGDVAIGMLQQAMAAEPDLLEAHQNLAFVYASLGRMEEAEAAIAETARRSPQEAEKLRQALTQFATDRSPRAASASSEDPHESVPPPAPAPAAAPPPPAQKGLPTAVFGWIEADAVRVRPGTVIFLTVRAAGVAQGPPAAVKRLLSASFPLPFELGAADSMMGQPLPERMRIDVRADSDGDPMTRPASDPAGYVDDVELGRTRVRIALQ